jgi:hypothetical protein
MRQVVLQDRAFDEGYTQATGAGVSAPSPNECRLTAAQFQTLAEVPAAVEWYANIDNLRTRRAYQGDLEDFCRFVGLATADEFRSVTRAHVPAWRADLERRCLAGATIRRKLAALASLYDHRLNSNAVTGGNPVHGVKRPRIETNEGKAPALGDHQAKALLDAPDPDTLKGKRGRAHLAGPRQYQHDADLRSPAEPARGLTHVQGEVLRCVQRGKSERFR